MTRMAVAIAHQKPRSFDEWCRAMKSATRGQSLRRRLGWVETAGLLEGCFADHRGGWHRSPGLMNDGLGKTPTGGRDRTMDSLPSGKNITKSQAIMSAPVRSASTICRSSLFGNHKSSSLARESLCLAASAMQRASCRHIEALSMPKLFYPPLPRRDSFVRLSLIG
jgi:hypothetical protein